MSVIGQATLKIGNNKKIVTFTTMDELADRIDEMVELSWPNDLPVLTDLSFESSNNKKIAA